jgi:hypothetical protein
MDNPDIPRSPAESNLSEGADGHQRPYGITAVFPQGKLTSTPWEGWWHEGPADDGTERDAHSGLNSHHA